MLPNVRLMIAATFAAVLMLIFGFGMFATFRVSHAPLEGWPHGFTVACFYRAQHGASPGYGGGAIQQSLRDRRTGEAEALQPWHYAAPGDKPNSRRWKVAAPAAEHPDQTATQGTPEPATPTRESADVFCSPRSKTEISRSWA